MNSPSTTPSSSENLKEVERLETIFGKPQWLVEYRKAAENPIGKDGRFRYSEIPPIRRDSNGNRILSLFHVDEIIGEIADNDWRRK